MRRITKGFDWLYLDGGFGQIIYGLLALCCGIAFITNVAATGEIVSGDSGYAGVLTVIFGYMTFSDRDV